MGYEKGDKIIYVPQGYGAVLHKSTTATRSLKGLYTDSFLSTVVASIGENTIGLAHFDLHTSPSLIKKMVELTKGTQVVIISKERDVIVKTNVTEYVRKNLQDQKQTYKEVVDKVTGIFVSFEPRKANGIHPQIQRLLSHSRPTQGGVIHHPQEWQFSTVQKIEELIGFRARRKAKKSRERTFFMFDGAHWENMVSELKIDDSDPLTRQEMEFFARENTFYVTMQKIPLLVQEIKVEDIFDRKHFKRIATSMETYLNNYDLDVIFKRNLTDSLSCDFNRSLQNTKQDRVWRTKMLKCLEPKKPEVEQLRNLYDKYEKDAPKSAFKSQLEVEFFGILLQYYERKRFADIAGEIKKVKAEAVAANSAGVQEYKSENYRAALEKFNLVLDHLTVASPKDLLLATCYFNIGKSLYNLKDYENAVNPLRTSLELTKALKKETDKIEKVLQECEEKSKK